MAYNAIHVRQALLRSILLKKPIDSLRHPKKQERVGQFFVNKKFIPAGYIAREINNCLAFGHEITFRLNACANIAKFTLLLICPPEFEHLPFLARTLTPLKHSKSCSI
jgi:hypothetical protein